MNTLNPTERRASYSFRNAAKQISDWMKRMSGIDAERGASPLHSARLSIGKIRVFILSLVLILSSGFFSC